MVLQAEIKTLHIWSHPESPVHFLEIARRGSEWQADIHLPIQNPDRIPVAEHIRQTFIAHGYSLTEKTEPDGHITLSIHHRSKKPEDVALTLQESGLTKGAAHSIQEPLMDTKALIENTAGTVGKMINYIKDPARANGLMFLAAEACLVMAGKGNDNKNWMALENLMQSLAGSLWMSQSLAYLFIAEKGEERILKDFKKQFQQEGLNNSYLPDLSKATVLGSKPATTTAGKTVQWVKDNPIQFGAWANNLGMFAFMGHALLRRNSKLAILKDPRSTEEAIKGAQKYIQEGFWWDIRGACTSLAAWTFMLMKPKHYTEEERASNPIGQAYQYLREHPHQAAGSIAVAASSQRLLGGLTKGVSPNKWQVAGEGIYIPGDLMLLFTNSSEYGGSHSGDGEALVKAMAKQINQLPIVMSPERINRFTMDAGNYLARQTLSMNDEKKEPDPQILKETTLRFQRSLAKQIDQTHHKLRFNRMIASANQLMSKFEPAMRSEVAEALANTLPELRGLESDSGSIRKRLMDKKPSQKHIHYRPLVMDDLVQNIADICLSISGDHVSGNVARLFETLDPLVQKNRAVRPRNQIHTSMVERASHHTIHPALAEPHAGV